MHGVVAIHLEGCIEFRAVAPWFGAECHVDVSFYAVQSHGYVVNGAGVAVILPCQMVPLIGSGRRTGHSGWRPAVTCGVPHVPLLVEIYAALRTKDEARRVRRLVHIKFQSFGIL